MLLDLKPGRPPLPKEHGGWAMLLTPPAIAVLAAGPRPLGLLAALGWIVGYALRGPVEALLGEAPTGRAGMQHANSGVARFWLVIFGMAAALLLAPVIYLRPWTLALLAGALALLGAILLLAVRGQTRSLAAGALAVVGLMMGGPLYYLAADGAAGAKGWTLGLVGGAFFLGSVFRVKTLARERRSAGFRAVAIGFHVVAVLAAGAAAWLGYTSWFVPVTLVPALGWSVYCARRAEVGSPVSLATVGHGEQWLTIAFGLMLAATLRF